MSWQNLLSETQAQVLPWAGGDVVYSRTRAFNLRGKLRPPEFGWYTFETDGSRVAKLLHREPCDPNLEFQADTKRLIRGYLVGDRLVPDGTPARVDQPLIEQSVQVYGAPIGLPRFTRAVLWRDLDGRASFLAQMWPLGPEDEVQAAYQDRKADLSHVPGVTPALNLAFRWLSDQRLAAEEAARKAQAELEQARREAELRAAATKAQAEREHLIRQYLIEDTGPARRALAQHDFNAAAAAALALTGAELLDTFPASKTTMVVQYRFKNRRLECICDKTTLRITEAGVCLDDHRGNVGDTRFTLESLPAVIDEAMKRGRLVVWRDPDRGNARGRGGEPHDWDDWDDRDED